MGSRSFAAWTPNKKNKRLTDLKEQCDHSTLFLTEIKVIMQKCQERLFKKTPESGSYAHGAVNVISHHLYICMCTGQE